MLLDCEDKFWHNGISSMPFAVIFEFCIQPVNQSDNLQVLPLALCLEILVK